MKTRNVSIVVLALVFGVGACGGGTPTTETPSADASEGTVRWVAEARGEDEVSGAPMTELRVEVALAGGTPETIAIGTLPGCAPVERGDTPVLASVHCFWAGQGDTVRVEHRGDAVIVTRQGEDSQVQEPFDVLEVGRVAVGAAAIRLVE